MAGIAAKFEADFSQFQSEVAKADNSLKGMTAVTASTTNAIQSLHTGLSSTDRILSSLGINLGPQIAALREMGEVVGKTTSSLGTVATAGLAVSAAFAGWQLGRYVADWLNLDEAIGGATSSLLGWGDASAEAAGANMDVLSRASQIAKRDISDLAEAQKIISAENARMAESFNTGADRVMRWGNEIANVRNAGNLPALRAEILAGNSTLQEMATHFGISTRALEFYIKGIKDSTAAQKAWADDAKVTYGKIAEAQEILNNAGGGWRKTLEEIQPQTVKVIEGYLAMGAPINAIATALNLTTLQVKAVSNGWDALMISMAKAEAKMVDHSKNFIETLIKNGAGYVEQSAKQLQQMQAIIALAGELDKEFNQQAQMSAREILASQVAMFEAMRGQDGFSDAWINQKLNELYERFYRQQGASGNMPGTGYQPGSGVAPGTYGQPTVTNNITVTQPLGTPEAIAQAIEEAQRYRYSASGSRV